MRDLQSGFVVWQERFHKDALKCAVKMPKQKFFGLVADVELLILVEA